MMKNKVVWIASLLMAAVAGNAAAAVEMSDGTAPSWMPMTMTSLKFNTTTNALYDQTAQMWDGYPNALSVATSRNFSYSVDTLVFAAPGTFDAASAFSVLNGTYYTRELGWYVPSGSKTALTNAVASYGTGAAVWIKVLSISEGLTTYKAVGSDGLGAADAYTEILSSVGAIWQWDYMMDHNTQSIDAAYVTHAGQMFSASYYVYVGDALGNEILNSDGSSTGMTENWSWTVTEVIPVPEPASVAVLVAGAVGLLRKRAR